jgi:hypothetical protein
VAIGRVKWIEGSKHTGKDNFAWYRFDDRHSSGPVFHWRDQIETPSRRTGVCEQCRKAYEPQRSSSRFCSQVCRQRAHRNRLSVTSSVTPAPSGSSEVFRYVRHADVPRFTAEGWELLPALDGTHHGEYSVLMRRRVEQDWNRARPACRATSNASHRARPDIEEIPMGMDIYGRNPTGKRGEYFCNNIWEWPSLADYCIAVAPDICAACRHWHSNDGDGLDATGALALADALEKEISAKRTEDFERRQRFAWEMAFPNEPCDFCAATGVQPPGPHRGAGDLKERSIECEECRGTG